MADGLLFHPDCYLNLHGLRLAKPSADVLVEYCSKRSPAEMFFISAGLRLAIGIDGEAIRDVMSKLSGWFDDYNENAPHIGLKMMSPRQFLRVANGN